MVKKKDSKKKSVKKLKLSKLKAEKIEDVPDTMKIATEQDIVLDFGTKVYKKFDKMIKSVVLFGSSVKRSARAESDIDVIIIIDDVAIEWDQELIGWYRDELGDIIKTNPYKKSLHVNTVKLSTWWQDLIRGDPIVINILRYGTPVIDFGGFFTPLQVLLKEGKIKSTPEAIYTLLQRAPNHMGRTRVALLGAIDGLYWAMVDSAHAALIAANVQPPSPEHIPETLTEAFVSKKMLGSNFVNDYAELHALAKEIVYGKKVQVSGAEIDSWIVKTDKFIGVMAELVDKLIDQIKRS